VLPLRSEALKKVFLSELKPIQKELKTKLDACHEAVTKVKAWELFDTD